MNIRNIIYTPHDVYLLCITYHWCVQVSQLGCLKDSQYTNCQEPLHLHRCVRINHVLLCAYIYVLMYVCSIHLRMYVCTYLCVYPITMYVCTCVCTL